jgi:3-deoxy-7-phosphoheptulonate synthase
MIVLMNRGADEKSIQKVVETIEEHGLRADISRGKDHTIIGVVGYIDLDKMELRSRLLSLGWVSDVKIISKPYKLASKEFGEYNEITVEKRIKGEKIQISFNEKNVVLIAGPCSVESYEQMDQIAFFLSGLGVRVLRGGAFKPRTSPRSFEGLGKEGLKILRAMSEKYGFLIVTELMDERHAELMVDYTDIIQIGARNMQNFALLKTVGDLNIPVLLKRGLSATIDEWLNAAEYILDRQKEKKVLLCERGIRTFETATRNTFDINAIPVLKSISWLPVIADPSHATGKWNYVTAVAMGSVAAGANGLMVEVHPEPSKALTDGAQSLTFESFENMHHEIERIARAQHKKLN